MSLASSHFREPARRRRAGSDSAPAGVRAAIGAPDRRPICNARGFWPAIPRGSRIRPLLAPHLIVLRWGKLIIDSMALAPDPCAGWQTSRRDFTSDPKLRSELACAIRGEVCREDSGRLSAGFPLRSAASECRPSRRPPSSRRIERK